MTVTRDKPLIVQGDMTILLDVHHIDFKQARDALMRFAELVKSPEHMHVYRLTPLSLWNAAASGLSGDAIVGMLDDLSRYALPGNVKEEIQEKIGRFGLLKLVNADSELQLVTSANGLMDRLMNMGGIEGYVQKRINGNICVIDPLYRGQLKVDLIKTGFPVEDLAGYRAGKPLPVSLRDTTAAGKPFALRPYQVDAMDAFHSGGSVNGGSGVIVLPCGAGKTIVGLALMEAIKTHTLILSTSVTAVKQWKREILDKTSLTEDMVGEYSGTVKEVRPVTLSTYQMMTHRRDKTAGFTHFNAFAEGDWGLVIYDEVHLLPAPVFRFTAGIQVTRRLGLTATLVREDGREDEVFSLIGPKKYDIPWRSLEKTGWIANARCVEVRVDLAAEEMKAYASAPSRRQYRLASENPAKAPIIRSLLARHAGDQVLIIGQYLSQLEGLSQELDCPLITGKTPNAKRETLYQQFRSGRIGTLIISKVGNFAVDLPDANVAIQISGTFGSRQEEAQRLGRILRPNARGGGSVFYSLVTRRSREQDFAEKRQLFLTEQGYEYVLCPAQNIPEMPS